MAQKLLFFLTALPLILATDIAAADPTILMKKIAKHNGTKPKIIGGQPADPADWPATRWFDQGCTSTIIGVRTVVTAAHCIGDGQSAGIELNNSTVPVTCNQDPDYASNTTADVALCLASNDLVAPGLKYESINIDQSYLQVGTPITLLGFGCTEPGGPAGALYVGTSTISQLPSGNDYRYTLSGGALTCAGDSGGAGYLSLAGARLIAGTHKSGDEQSISIQVETAVPKILDFYRTWAVNNSTVICGINSNATNCR